MRPLLLATAFVALTLTPALAGGTSAPPPLINFMDVSQIQFSGPSLPFGIDIDTTKTRHFRDNLPGPRILITAFSPEGWIVIIDSRPLNPGEKLHWKGKLPAKGKWVARVVNATGNGTISSGDLPDLTDLQHAGAKEFTLQVVTDAQGNLQTR